MDLDKYQTFGLWTKTLIELHKEKPNVVKPEKVVELLEQKYLELGFKPVEGK